MREINTLSARRQELFRQAADGVLPMRERGQLKELSDEINRLWDNYRRAGHPPATPPVKDDWDAPRRGRKPAVRPPAEPVEATTDEDWPAEKEFAA